MTSRRASRPRHAAALASTAWIHHASNPGGSLGVGVWLVRRIVQAMRRDVVADDGPHGNGTTLTVRAPRSPP